MPLWAEIDEDQEAMQYYAESLGRKRNTLLNTFDSVEESYRDGFDEGCDNCLKKALAK